MIIFTVIHTHKYGVDVIPCSSMEIAEKTRDIILNDSEFSEYEEFVEISSSELKVA